MMSSGSSFQDDLASLRSLHSVEAKQATLDANQAACIALAAAQSESSPSDYTTQSEIKESLELKAAKELAKQKQTLDTAAVMKEWKRKNRPVILLIGDSLTEQSFNPYGGWGSTLADTFNRRADVVSNPNSLISLITLITLLTLMILVYRSLGV